MYHEFAHSYDLVAWLVSRGRWRAWGAIAIDYIVPPMVPPIVPPKVGAKVGAKAGNVVGGRVLELGHGPGHLQVTLAHRGFQPVGLDLSRQMSRIAWRRLTRAGLSPRLVHGRAQRLPFSSAAFDSVVATFPTAFITEPPTLAEVARILRPGGRLVVVLGARLAGTDPLTRFIEWLYHITGQREIEQAGELEKPFRAAGLSPAPVYSETAGSEVFLLVCERQRGNVETWKR